MGEIEKDLPKNQKLVWIDSGGEIVDLMDEEMIKEIAQEGLVWTNPQWKNYDGTIAEW